MDEKKNGLITTLLLDHEINSTHVDPVNGRGADSGVGLHRIADQGI